MQKLRHCYCNEATIEAHCDKLVWYNIKKDKRPDLYRWEATTIVRSTSVCMVRDEGEVARLEGFNAHTKRRILQHALNSDNISETCALFGISRPTFYKWRAAYQKFGLAGLKNKERAKPKMPNKVSKAVEKEILDYVLRCPKDGPRRIYYELKSEGIRVGETGIFNVLKRNNLTRQNQRQAYAKNRKLNPKIINKKNKKIQNLLQGETNYPGNLVVQKMDYIGSFDKIGRIYQYSFYDTASKWVEIKLYNRRNDIDIWDFFESKLVYLLEIFGLSFKNLVTDKEREFLPHFLEGKKHEEIIANYQINHIFSTVKEEDIFHEIMEFNRRLAAEFYHKIEEREDLESFAQLDSEITTWIRNHNFERMIEEGANVGKTPAQVVLAQAVENGADLNTLPLWILALINSER